MASRPTSRERRSKRTRKVARYGALGAVAPRGTGTGSRARRAAASAGEVCAGGSPATTLAELFAFSPADQVHVLKLESCRNGPNGRRARASSSLGIATGCRPADLAQPQNVAQGSKRELT